MENGERITAMITETQEMNFKHCDIEIYKHSDGSFGISLDKDYSLFNVSLSRQELLSLYNNIKSVLMGG